MDSPEGEEPAFAQTVDDLRAWDDEGRSYYICAKDHHLRFWPFRKRPKTPVRSR